MASDLIVQETAMIVSRWKVQESTSCLVHKTRCLSWSSVDVRILKKHALMAVKEWSEDKQAKIKASFFHEFI